MKRCYPPSQITLLIMWIYQVAWQKNVTSPFSRDLWQLNYTGGYHLIGKHQLKSLLLFCSSDHVRSHDK